MAEPLERVDIVDQQRYYRSALRRGEFVYRLLVGTSVMAATAAALFILWYALQVFLLAFAGMLLAILLNTLADWLRRVTGLRYRWAFLATVLLGAGLIGAAAWRLGGQLTGQFTQIQKSLPHAVEQVRTQLQKLPWGPFVSKQIPDVSTALDQLQELVGLDRIFSSVVAFVTGVIVLLFVGLYGAAQPELYREGFLRLFPLQRRERVADVLQTVTYSLRWWMLGQLVTMTIVGVVIGMGLWLAGVPLAFALAVLAFTLELVPNFGPIVSGGLGVLIASSQGSTTALYALSIYVGVQILESYILYPLIQLETVWLPPAVTILSVVLLGLLAGLLGVFLATPLTVTAIVVIKTLYIEDTLGDRSVEVPGEPTS